MNQTTASCTCGKVTLEIKGTPLLRFICHCTICQRFNSAPYGDAIVYLSAIVKEPDAESVSFTAYKPPPNVQRGKCIACASPIVEQLKTPLFPKLTIIPTAKHEAQADLPAPFAHLFYDQRVAEVNDQIPKHKGFWLSQLAFVKQLIAAKREK